MKIYLFLFIGILSGCSDYEPAAAVVQTGFGNYLKEKSSLELKNQVVDICEKRNCSKIHVRSNLSNIDLNIDLYTTDNDKIHLNKYINNSLYISFSQKEMTKPSIKTILVLRDLKEAGFELNYTGGEKWQCNGRALSRKNCRQEKNKGERQDFLDYIVQDNHMKFEYKDGDKTIQL